MSEELTPQFIKGYIQASHEDLELMNYDGDLDQLYMMEALTTRLEAAEKERDEAKKRREVWANLTLSRDARIVEVVADNTLLREHFAWEQDRLYSQGLDDVADEFDRAFKALTKP